MISSCIPLATSNGRAAVSFASRQSDGLERIADLMGRLVGADVTLGYLCPVLHILFSFVFYRSPVEKL